MSQSKILAFAGSARKDSFNKKLVAFVAEKLRQRDVEVTLIDLADYSMPLYNGDLEAAEGSPEAADRLYQLMKEHDGFLIACPEYNSSITPLLKNTIDWMSRPREGDQPLEAFGGKCAALCAASPGRLGGMRGLVHVTSILQSIGTMVVPVQAAVGSAHEAFDENGELKDERTAGLVEKMCDALASAVRGMVAG